MHSGLWAGAAGSLDWPVEVSMVLQVWDFVSSLSRSHWAFLCATFVSVVAVDALPWFIAPSPTVSEHLSPVIYHLAWFPVAVLLMAAVVRHDRSSAELKVDQKLEGVLEEIQTMRERQERVMTNLQSQIVAMDTIMRSGFEALGYSASSDSVSLKMGGTPSVSAALVLSQPRNKSCSCCVWS